MAAAPRGVGTAKQRAVSSERGEWHLGAQRPRAHGENSAVRTDGEGTTEGAVAPLPGPGRIAGGISHRYKAIGDMVYLAQDRWTVVAQAYPHVGATRDGPAILSCVEALPGAQVR